MIPIRDTIPSKHIAWMVRFLVSVNILVFLFELGISDRIEDLLYRFGVVPSYWGISSFADILRLPFLIGSLISSQFLHGSVGHLLFNMLYLWVFGDNIEDRLGPARFVALYLVGGMAAGLLQIIVFPDSSAPMIGASGAIAGILGAYFVLFPFSRIITIIPLIFVWERVELPAFLFLGFWFIWQWLQGIASIGQIASSGVAWWAHVGGFVTGLVLINAFKQVRSYKH